MINMDKPTTKPNHQRPQVNPPWWNGPMIEAQVAAATPLAWKVSKAWRIPAIEVQEVPCRPQGSLGCFAIKSAPVQCCFQGSKWSLHFDMCRQSFPNSLEYLWGIPWRSYTNPQSTKILTLVWKAGNISHHISTVTLLVRWFFGYGEV